MRQNVSDLCRADRSGMRQVSEPGGCLLVGLGAPGGALANAIGRHRDDVSLTVLISPAQQEEA